MLLGFISLLLTVGSTLIYKICIPAHYGRFMLPCKYKSETAYEKDTGSTDQGDDENSKGSDDHGRKLLFYDGDMAWRRVLATPATGGEGYCTDQVEIPSPFCSFCLLSCVWIVTQC